TALRPFPTRRSSDLQHVERTSSLAQPTHAVVDAPGSEPRLRDEKSLPPLAEKICRRDPHILVKNLGVPVAETLVLTGQGWDVAHLFQARRVGRNADHRRA